MVMVLGYAKRKSRHELIGKLASTFMALKLVTKDSKDRRALGRIILQLLEEREHEHASFLDGWTAGRAYAAKWISTYVRKCAGWDVKDLAKTISKGEWRFQKGRRKKAA